MDYVDLALDFKLKKLADFIDVINENSKIARKFKPILTEYCTRVFDKYPDIELRPFYRNLKDLEVIECTDQELLKVALLLKVSTPAAEFDKKVGKDIMRESLQMIYEYMSTIVLGDDLDWIYGNFVFDQVKAFDKNVDWYFANWRDDFSDYVDDLMQIAANELSMAIGKVRCRMRRIHLIFRQRLQKQRKMPCRRIVRYHWCV